MKIVITVISILFATQAQAFTSGKISCQLGNINIQGSFSNRGFYVTSAGVLKVSQLDRNPVLGERFGRIASKPWSANGVMEYELTINKSGEHGAFSEDLMLPLNLREGTNPALLLLTLNTFDRHQYDGTCVYSK